jgi:hypothetical protein
MAFAALTVRNISVPALRFVRLDLGWSVPLVL